MDIDHVYVRAFAETVCEKSEQGLTYPSAVLMLARAYLDVAPDHDADLIDEDPLPDGYDVDEVPGKTDKFYVSELVWQQGCYRFKGRKAAVREAWRRYHEEGSE